MENLAHIYTLDYEYSKTETTQIFVARKGRMVNKNRQYKRSKKWLFRTIDF